MYQLRSPMCGSVTWIAHQYNSTFPYRMIYRVDSRYVSSQWETALLCNKVSHLLGASQASALVYVCPIVSDFQNLLVSRIWVSHGSGWLEMTLIWKVNGVGLLPVGWCQLMAGTAANPTITMATSTACPTTMRNLAGEMTIATIENQCYASSSALHELVSSKGWYSCKKPLTVTYVTQELSFISTQQNVVWAPRIVYRLKLLNTDTFLNGSSCILWWINYCLNRVVELIIP